MKLRVASLVTMLMLCMSAQALPVLNWSVSGPGGPTATTAGAETTFAYNATPSFGAGYMASSATVTEAGDYVFDYLFTGHHSWYLATAYLTTSDGGTLVNQSASGGFSFSGSYTFTGVTAGQTIAFNFGGANYDSSRLLQGQLVITQTSVPAPGLLALFGLGIIGISIARRKVNG
ncbi:MAG: PEP-CTERM sorting domain-containing protein [Pseudomonadota bacterium]